MKGFHVRYHFEKADCVFPSCNQNIYGKKVCVKLKEVFASFYFLNVTNQNFISHEIM